MTLSTLERPTLYRYVYHDFGRYPVLEGNCLYHKGYVYKVNATTNSGVRLDILKPILEELDAMTHHYSRVFLSRFDLRVPAGTPVSVSNEWVRLLGKSLRERLGSKLRRPKSISEPIKKFAFGWVREREKAIHDHYHFWIALPHRLVKSLGNVESGVGGLIAEIWMKLTGGNASLVEYAKSSSKYSDHYVIRRNEPETLEGPVYWLSYLAKERGKTQTGKGDRVHSTSRTRSRVNKKVDGDARDCL